jgi:uncharacterized membrane protein YidH (DUF202 family)
LVEYVEELQEIVITNYKDPRTSLAVTRTILAEKRTHLAELRTGIGILTIPLSLLTILIATSEYYMISEVLSFIIGLAFGVVLLMAIGTFLVARSLSKIRKNDKIMNETCLDLSALAKEFNSFPD